MEDQSPGLSRGPILLAGGIVGALTGVVLAYMISQRAEEQGGRLDLSTGEGLRLGLLVLGMLRQVADLANPDQLED